MSESSPERIDYAIDKHWWANWCWDCALSTQGGFVSDPTEVPTPLVCPNCGGTNVEYQVEAENLAGSMFQIPRGWREDRDGDADAPDRATE